MTSSPILLTLLGSVVGVSSVAMYSDTHCASSSNRTNAGMIAPETGKDIVDTAVAAGSFKTLAAALGAADLVEALKGDGPFTVFAPTDEAFAKLPAGTVDHLLKPENKEMLQSILLYHVVPGEAMASDVLARNSWETLNGQQVTISADNGPMIENAKIVKTDISASNGVIHVIDTVILPETKNIVELGDSAGMFSTLLAAAKAAGLAETLSSDGPFTIFAPTDDAFAQLPEGTVAELLKPENKHTLAAILKYHVVPGRVYAGQALTDQSAETVQGQRIRFSIADGRFKVNNANVIKTDLDASNGVVHVIDRVILPQ